MPNFSIFLWFLTQHICNCFNISWSIWHSSKLVTLPRYLTWRWNNLHLIAFVLISFPLSLWKTFFKWFRQSSNVSENTKVSSRYIIANSSRLLNNVFSTNLWISAGAFVNPNDTLTHRCRSHFVIKVVKGRFSA